MPSSDTTASGAPHAQSSLEALSEIAALINSLQEPEALLETVLTIAMQRLESERGAPFEVRASRNFTDSQLDGVKALSTSVVAEVLRSGEPVLVYEAATDERYGATESVVLQKIQSIACVPLRLRSRQIGAIYLDSVSHRGRFTRENLPFLKAFAHQAAVAIENAQRVQHLRDENRHLRQEVQRAHGFDEIIGQSARMREVFETVSRVLDTD